MRRLALGLVALLAMAGLAFAQQGQRRGGDVAGQFDYYLLALSWSPTYCADSDNAQRDRLQCGVERKFSFVVHGLWPQRERGYPERCATREPADVSKALVDAQLDMMPSRGLIQHQWDKHGACSGLTQKAYFDLTRTMRNKVIIPAAYRDLTKPMMTTGAEVEAAFVAANPGLKKDMVAVTCDQRRIKEVRVCFTKQGALRACGADVRDTCGADRKVLPPVRGGR